MPKAPDPKKDPEFNETLKNLLKTPPKHHDDEKKGGRKPPPKKEAEKRKTKGKEPG